MTAEVVVLHPRVLAIFCRDHRQQQRSKAMSFSFINVHTLVLSHSLVMKAAGGNQKCSRQAGVGSGPRLWPLLVIGIEI